MSQKKSRDRVQFSTGGDNINGVESLSELTTINPSFRRLIGLNETEEQEQQIPPASHPTFEIDQSTILQNPEELQLRLTQSQPLASSQKTIEYYQKQNLELKLLVHRLQESSGMNGENFNVEDFKKDLVSDLREKNRQLEKKLEEREKKARREDEKRMSRLQNAECQTNLESSHIDELFEDRLTLKRTKEQRLLIKHASTQTHQPPQQQQQYQQPHQPPQQHHYQQHQPQYSHQTQHQFHPQQAHHQYQHQNHQIQYSQPLQQAPSRVPEHEPHPIMSQLHYPSVTITKQVATTKQLAPDEKEILETLFRVNGCMTTALDKLKAVSDTH